MRNEPPHKLIRYRHGLIAAAIVAWLVAAGMMLAFKGRTDIPVTAIVGAAALIFVWGNGFYWLLILAYPYMEVPPGGVFVSRLERHGKSQPGAAFFICYFIVAIIASAAIFNVVFSAA